MSTRTERVPLPTYGTLMTMQEFSTYVESGYIIDYDGYGYLATEEWHDYKVVVPSDLKSGKKYDPIYTHVLWFNR